MEQALLQVGLPVKCRCCDTTGFVKPGTDYGGWYKSKLFRMRPRKNWFCPEHAQIGIDTDRNFYERYKTPDSTKESKVENIEEELYKLLD